MNHGLHFDVPADRYHADMLADAPSLSSGIAKILLRHSPRAARHAHPRLNPAYRDDSDPKFDIGTASHAMFLEGEQKNIVIVDADDWRTKAAKERRAEANAAGKTALLARHFDAVKTMTNAAAEFVASSEIADQWNADDAKSEVTGLVRDRGVWLRCRFDRLSVAHRFIGDYKTTTDVSPDTFSRLIVSLGYHIQEAFYRRCARLVGIEEPRFVFLAQSVEQPHECTLHACDPAMREIGDYEVERAVSLWHECLTRKEWPSYGGRIHWAMPTNWQMNMYEQRLQEAA